MSELAGEKVFFVYLNDDTGKPYFYDTETQVTTYDKPAKGLLIDPDTSAPFVFPIDPSACFSPASGDDPPPAPGVIRFLSRSQSTYASHAVVAISASPPRRRRKRRIQPSDHSVSSPERLPEGVPRRSATVRQAHRPPPLPAPEERVPPPVPDRILGYAEEFFEVRMRRGELKTRLPAGQVFQESPIKLPLLPTMGKAMAKNALEAFRLVLAYTGADGMKKAPVPAARALLQLCIAAPDLRDELYFQLVKQVRKNKNEDCRRRTWELFLLVATAIPLGPESEVEIKCHLATFSQSKKPTVAEFAEFTFIRFSARCSIGEALDALTPELIASIPRDAFVSHVTFGASIYEQLHTQRHVYPNLPIPYIVYLFAQMILEKGGMQSEGLFRLAGNSAVVWEMIAAVNRGSDLLITFAPGTLKDIAQVFKLWFSNLPERIVPISKTDRLRTVFETTKDYEAFLTELPSAHVRTLQFLCGFLKEVATAEEVTKMGIKNLATVFAPNIVALPRGIDASEVAGQTACAQEFFTRLLELWDTSSMYPIPDEFLH
jgi:hypothetical protein